MENKLVFRRLTESDYNTICKWWKWWRWSVMPKESLPDDGKSGFMVEKNNIPIVRKQKKDTLWIYQYKLYTNSC